MACATERVRLTSSFVNNLFRSPVEVAQAALAMQALSGGRFELGLGAGWAKHELEGAGLAYPDPGERAGRYREAVEIVRALLGSGSCRYEGRWYQVDVPALGPRTGAPPPLVASLGGPRTTREIAPLVDRVEIKPISPATRDGALDLAAMAQIPESHVKELVERVRATRPDVPLSLFCLCSAGDDARTKGVSELLGDSFMGRFFGPPEQVADALLGLADLGFSRAQVSPFGDASFELLAPHLFG